MPKLERVDNLNFCRAKLADDRLPSQNSQLSVTCDVAAPEHHPRLRLLLTAQSVEAVMRVFQVRQRATGAILWTGAAVSELAAFDAMAHEAGYYDFSDLPEHVRAGGLVAELIATAAATVPLMRHR